VRTCAQDRLYLKVVLDVDYSQLLQFSLSVAHDSLAKALADLAGVSPLRVTDIHVRVLFFTFFFFFFFLWRSPPPLPPPFPRNCGPFGFSGER